MKENGGTFGTLLRYADGKYKKIQGMEDLGKRMDEVKPRHLEDIFVANSIKRAKEATSREVLYGNRFHTPSQIDQRELHSIEGIIFKEMPDIQFVELSPLQPLGLNEVLAGIRENNVVAAVRRSEVNADITASLFRTAYSKLENTPNLINVTLAGNSRITRAQDFKENTKFLPHFKMFGEVSVGRETDMSNPEGGKSELETFADHLAREVKVLDAVKRDPRFKMKDVNIQLGNVGFMRELIGKGLVNKAEIIKHTGDPGYKVFEEFNIDLPRSIELDSPYLSKIIENSGLTKGVRALDAFNTIFSNKYPELISRTELSLDRIAGAGYYKNMAYKITASNEDGEVVPLVDGGTTKWAHRFSGSKKFYTVVSGIGTELLCQYFIRR